MISFHSVHICSSQLPQRVPESQRWCSLFCFSVLYCITVFFQAAAYKYVTIDIVIDILQDLS